MTPRAATPRAAAPRAARPPRLPDSPGEAADEDAAPSLAEVLVDMLEEGRRSSARGDDIPRREPPVAATGTPLLAGCLGRLMLLVLLLIVLALAGLSTFFGGG